MIAKKIDEDAFHPVSIFLTFETAQELLLFKHFIGNMSGYDLVDKAKVEHTSQNDGIAINILGNLYKILV